MLVLYSVPSRTISMGGANNDHNDELVSDCRGVAAIIVAAVVFGSAPASGQNQHMEIIHHPNYDKNVFMPFVPAIKIKSGKILWFAGTTALPVYHDHPHKRDEIQQYMTNDLEAQ